MPTPVESLFNTLNSCYHTTGCRYFAVVRQGSGSALSLDHASNTVSFHAAERVLELFRIMCVNSDADSLALASQSRDLADHRVPVTVVASGRYKRFKSKLKVLQKHANAIMAQNAGAQVLVCCSATVSSQRRVTQFVATPGLEDACRSLPTWSAVWEPDLMGATVDPGMDQLVPMAGRYAMWQWQLHATVKHG